LFYWITCRSYLFDASFSWSFFDGTVLRCSDSILYEFDSLCDGIEEARVFEDFIKEGSLAGSRPSRCGESIASNMSACFKVETEYVRPRFSWKSLSMDTKCTSTHGNHIATRGYMDYGCQHYWRRCRIRAPCCNEIFDCRHCHNEAKVSHDKFGDILVGFLWALLVLVTSMSKATPLNYCHAGVARGAYNSLSSFLVM
ncbi:hypothetical protein Dimus_011952, partial [Dionaea muscipula]